MINALLCPTDRFEEICKQIQKLESPNALAFDQTTGQPFISAVKEEGFDQEKEPFDQKMDILHKTKRLAKFILTNVENDHHLASIGIKTLSGLEKKVNDEKAVVKLEKAISKLHSFTPVETKKLKNLDHRIRQAKALEKAKNLTKTGRSYVEEGKLEEAIKLFRKAARMGYPTAQRELGYYYSLGKGLDKNDVKAVKWLEKAALQGDILAQNNFACHLAQGEGVDQDDEKAFSYYKKAAKRNLAAAQASVGCAKEHGLGTHKNLTKAKKFYQLAADQGNQQGIEGLARLEKEEISIIRLIFRCFKSSAE